MSTRVAVPLNIPGLVLADFEVNDDGMVSKIQGTLINEIKVTLLQEVCRKMKVKGVRGMKRDDLLKELGKHLNNLRAYDKYDEEILAFNNERTKKEIHCSFRLMNILFSDKFASDFAALGLSPSRAVLDSGKAGCDRHFWERVAADFKSDEESYGELLFATEDPVFERQVGLIVPSKIVQHDWKKLRQIWKNVVADYKAAHRLFTLSGTHDNEFYNFCHGKLEPYYLRKLLDIRPGLVGYVSADLPEFVFIDSEPPIELSANTTSDNQSGGSESEHPGEDVDGSMGNDVPPPVEAGGTRNGGESFVEPVDAPPNQVGCGVASSSVRRKSKRMSDLQGIGDAMTRLGSERKEVAEKRNELYEKDVSIREKDVSIREKDVLIRETYMKETVCMKKEYFERKNSKALFSEWETVRMTITRLRNELRADGIDDETKHELENDINQLKNKKRKLSEKMGLV